MQVSDATSNANQLKVIIEESILNLVAKKKRVTALNLANTGTHSPTHLLTYSLTHLLTHSPKLLIALNRC